MMNMMQKIQSQIMALCHYVRHNCFSVSSSIRPDQINLLLYRFTGPIFSIPKKNFRALMQMMTSYREVVTFAT